MAGVNKFLYSILYFLRQEIGSDFPVNPDLTIREILAEESFDELDFIIALIHFEMNHAIDIPDGWLEQKDITLREFARRASELPEIEETYIPEFHQIKTGLISYLITTVKNAQWHQSNNEMPN
ncbi:MAG: hypothetical protein FMNOHCHN_03037 [Ignavibacteriaceae bacterium]|nr:hypothetical protein [Ignavibacteriaceae bacterium]